MWRIKSISAENFMSYGRLDYIFESKCYMVQSQNHDNESQASNGGGKSSFVDIIALTLLGYSLTGRDVKSCVSWNNDLGYFTVYCKLENKEHDLVCEISRKVYAGTKSTELNILINGEVPKDLPTKRGVKDGVDIRAGDEYILKSVLDIKADDLLNYFIISGKYYKPFLKVNTDSKLEVIGRFTNTVAVDKVLNGLEGKQKSLKIDIELNNSLMAKASGYIEALNASMNEDAEGVFNTQKESDIAELTVRHSKIERQILQLEEELQTENERDFHLHEIDEEAIQEINALITTLSDEERSLSKDKEKTEQSIAHIKKHLAGLITCPKCSHKFHLTSKDKLTEDDVNKAANALQIIKENLDKAKLNIVETNELSKQVNVAVNENKKIQAEIQARDRTIKSIEQQQNRLMKELEGLEQQLETVSSRVFADQRGDISEQIRAKENEILVLQDSIRELEEDHLKASDWIVNFEDFKFFLGNKPLEIICNLCNQYLEFNGSDLNLQIEGFKKLKSGEIRQALNPVIYRNWQNPQSYASFSAGEQCRLNISVDLAFQQLINNSSKYGGLDLYLSDELMNNLDSLGIQNAAEAFNQLNKTMLLVSHSGADLNYRHTIMIEKRNGISQLV